MTAGQGAQEAFQRASCGRFGWMVGNAEVIRESFSPLSRGLETAFAEVGPDWYRESACAGWRWLTIKSADSVNFAFRQSNSRKNKRLYSLFWDSRS